MSTSRDIPPSEWAGATRIDDEHYFSFDSDVPPSPSTCLVWHWCETTGRWQASYCGAHTIVSADPLHLEASLLFSWCCNGHGFIRGGAWVPA